MDNSFHRWEQHFDLPAVAHVAASRPFAWLRSGWDDLRSHPLTSLAYGAVFALAGWLILALTLDRGYLFTAAVSGFFLVAPLLAAGLYELSRRRSAGESTTFFDSFACWRRNSASLSLFGLSLAIVAIAWERLSAILFALLATGATPTDPTMFMRDILLSGDYPRLVAVWMLAGLAMAAFVFAISAVSVPMMVDKPVDIATGMMTSLKAVSSNLGAMAVWAALIVALTLVGFATLMFGLVLIMPLLGHATWHAYKDIVR